MSGPSDGLHAAAIVVLGARVRPDGRPSAALERRMRVAISLYQAGVAPRLLLSGGGRQAMPERDRTSICHSMRLFGPTGNRHFGRSAVSGSKREPCPALRITAFMGFAAHHGDRPGPCQWTGI